MRKYNIANYVRYKKDVEAQLKKVRKPVDGDYTPLTNKEIQINFLPLVETLARKQSTSDQASGVLSINDLLQEGALGLCAAVSKLDRELLIKSDDQEKTLKSFLSKRIKGAIRRSVDINRGDIRIPEHKLNEIRRNPKDEKMVAMFFNSVFSSIDANPNDDENMAYQVVDKSEPYNIALLNTYLLSLMRTHLTPTQYDV
jgi:DNA-directed RNA polymerase specialized sigma subunit